MADSSADPANHIKQTANSCGAVYEMPTASGQKDGDGNAIASDWVGTGMKAIVAGVPLAAADASGNTCDPEKIAGADNLSFSEKMRVLFIGEDTSTHLNNNVWAYHIDTGKLSRILSIPAGAEFTGLQAVDNENGFSYVMSNYQHAAEFSYSFESWPVNKASPALAARLAKLIDRKKGAVGYIGNLPKLQ